MDRLQLNEESIWDGEPNRDRNNPKAAAAMPRIRELLFAGSIAEAEALAVSDVLSIPRRMPCYQTLGRPAPRFCADGSRARRRGRELRLQLDLDTAVAKDDLSPQRNVTYTRRCSSSAPDQVIVMRITADQPGSLHLRLSLDRPGSVHTSAPLRTACYAGAGDPCERQSWASSEGAPTGVRFHAGLLAVPEGGTILSARSAG